MPGTTLIPTPAQQARLRFIDGVSSRTGLSKAVVAAWIQAEGAYAHNGTGHYNFLNVAPSSNAGVPEGRSSGGFATFRSVDDAITATVNVLHQPNMRPILIAGKRDDNAQINAIAHSPWDQDQYKGGSNTPGTTLRAAYRSITKGPQSVGPIGAGVNPGVTDIAGNAIGALNPMGWLGGLESWAEGAALRSLAYLVLTVVAIALFVLGLERTLGPTPLTRRPGMPGGQPLDMNRLPAGADPIPY